MMKKTMTIALLAMSAIVLCCCGNKNNKCDDCEALGIVSRTFEERFPSKTVSVDPLYIKEGKSFKMSFSSMEEAEYKIVHCLGYDKPDYLYEEARYDITQKVILSDASSMDYSFENLVEPNSFVVLDSYDGQVRCYGWVYYDGGYHPDLMVQYKGKDGVVYTVDNDDFEKDESMASENEYYLYPERVFRFKNKGDIYTMICGYYGFGGGAASYGLMALKMDEKGVAPAMIFKDEELGCELNLYYCFVDWADALYDGEFELVRFDEEESAIYLAEIIEEKIEDHYYCNRMLSGRYKKYVWDGEAFSLQEGRSYPIPHICKEIQDYQQIMTAYDTERNKIWVDRMPNGSFRYVAWKSNETVYDAPELIITGGRFDGSCYVFKNKGYEYRVEEDGVKVTKNGKTVGEWERIYSKDEDNLDFTGFKKRVVSSPSTMSCSFDFLRKKEGFSIVDSDDGLVRIYTWEAPHFWTMSDFQEIIQYKWNGKVLVQGEKECDWEYCPTSEAQHIYTVHGESKTYYLIPYFFKEWSSLAFMSFQAFELTQEGLMPVGIFGGKDGSESLDFEYNIPDWFFKANLGEGYEWLCYYDQENRIYYHPETDYYLSDRYEKYVFDGSYFVLTEESSANPFLSASLHDYKSLVELFETKRNKIRIDLMEDETYRYAAWKAGDKMIDDPELVILNGTFDEASSKYVFINDGYEYQVFDNQVSVIKGGKQVAKWEVYNRWTDE